MPSDDGRSLVVTGGSGGIGAAVVRAAARRGWYVWIGYATGADRAAALAGELAAAGLSAATVALPLDEPERLRAGVAMIAERGPLPAGAVLCGAPAPDIAPVTKLEPEHFRRQLECAVVGHHVLLAELWRHCFKPRGGGHVLAVSSAAQGPETAAPHMASYVVAKGAFEALLRAMAAELGRAGLRVSVIRPGYVETPMLAAFDSRLLDRARAAAPGGRFLSPSDVAAALMAALRHPPGPGMVGEIGLDDRRAGAA